MQVNTSGGGTGAQWWRYRGGFWEKGGVTWAATGGGRLQQQLRRIMKFLFAFYI